MFNIYKNFNYADKLHNNTQVGRKLANYKDWIALFFNGSVYFYGYPLMYTILLQFFSAIQFSLPQHILNY